MELLAACSSCMTSSLDDKASCVQLLHNIIELARVYGNTLADRTARSVGGWASLQGLARSHESVDGVQGQHRSCTQGVSHPIADLQ